MARRKPFIRPPSHLMRGVTSMGSNPKIWGQTPKPYIPTLPHKHHVPTWTWFLEQTVQNKRVGCSVHCTAFVDAASTHKAPQSNCLPKYRLKNILYSCYSFLINEISQKTRRKILLWQSLRSAPLEQIFCSRVGCGWIQNQIKSDSASRPLADRHFLLIMIVESPSKPSRHVIDFVGSWQVTHT